MTPEQSTGYLQVSWDTIYRYIHDGRLLAARLGRSYRIPRLSLDRLLWNSRSSNGIQLRTYTDEKIAEFLEDDKLDAESREVVAQLGLVG
jgi:excisionase family DNA binding protein